MTDDLARLKDAGLPRLGAWVAEDLDARLYPYAAKVRDLAEYAAALERRLEELDAAELHVEGGCEGCGAAVTQPRTGRPRKYCTTCSPPRRSRKTLH